MPIFLLLAAVSAGAGESSVSFYVAPDGNDQWTGTLQAPNRKRTDGPFASIRRAQEALRSLKQGKPKGKGALVVILRGGMYYLEKPLEFTPDDSGSADAPVVYRAYPGEGPVLSGGVRLTGWKITAEGHWRLTIPDVKQGKWYFSQIFVNGQRRYRPRLPKDGYYHIAGSLSPSEKAKDKGFDRFTFNEGEINPGWKNLQDIETLCFQVWTMARMRIESVDEKKCVVNFSGNTRGLQSYSALREGNRYLLENVADALQEPGEWYLDRKTGVLTYIPLPGETPETAVVIAPRLEKLVELKGDVQNRQWVRRIHFKEITFAHTNYNCPVEGNAFAQAEAHMSAAISAEGARSCIFEGCSIRRLGAWALELGRGCQNNRVDSCEIVDMGAGGVRIGLMSMAQDKEDMADYNVVSNCLIAHGGRMHPAAVGVWIGHSPYNRISHNDIHDFYYTGVSVGWSWGYGASQANHNIVQHNHIHQIGQGVLSDMGGIYTLGLAPGSVLRHNLIHGIKSFKYGGWGIYFDEGTTDMLAENNVVYDCKSAGFHQHYGKGNIVRNNIFAFGQDSQLMRTRAEEHVSFTFEHNIVYWADGPLLGSNWKDGRYLLDYNLYFKTGGKPIDFMGLTLQEWNEKGQDIHSIIADPLFIDPDRRNFRLRPGSPAGEIGFVPIDMTGFGRTRSGGSSPDIPRAFPDPFAK